MTTDKKQNAKQEIDRLVKEAYAAINLAEEIAKEHNVSFGFDLAYGMGGVYEPEEGGWCPSSQSC
jgi:hypothetical protein